MKDTATIADQLGAADVFALRRVGESQLVNLAGFGRGDGWAGNISVEPESEPIIGRALTSSDVQRHRGDTTRIFGPYWSDSAAVISMGDFVFVIGGADVDTLDDDTLIEAAGELAWSIGDTPAEKQLADELEVTQAALAIATLPVPTLDRFLEDLADAAIEALACEFGAVVIRGPEPRVVVAPSGWQPDASYDQMQQALLDLLDTIDSEGPDVSQDLSEDPTANRPLGFHDGLVSRCVIPLSIPDATAAIVVAHAETAPRGFTSLCQVVAKTIGVQASAKLSTSLADPPNGEPSVGAKPIG